MVFLLFLQGTKGETSEQPKDVSSPTNWPSAHTWHFSCSPIGLYIRIRVTNVEECSISFLVLFLLLLYTFWAIILGLFFSAYLSLSQMKLVSHGLLVVACYVLLLLPKNLALCLSLIVNDSFRLTCRLALPRNFCAMVGRTCLWNTMETCKRGNCCSAEKKSQWKEKLQPWLFFFTAGVHRRKKERPTGPTSLSHCAL
jgi:hypothetical protein